eukprot:370967-Rhodomonas_salina.1
MCIRDRFGVTVGGGSVSANSSSRNLQALAGMQAQGRAEERRSVLASRFVERVPSQKQLRDPAVQGGGARFGEEGSRYEQAPARNSVDQRGRSVI